MILSRFLLVTPMIYEDATRPLNATLLSDAGTHPSALKLEAPSMVT